MVKTNQLKQTKGIVVDESAASELETSVFPNPHQGNFTVKVISPEKGKARIEMLTANGQLLLEKFVPVFKGDNIVSFTKMPPGILFNKVTVGKRQTKGKVAGIQ